MPNSRQVKFSEKEQALLHLIPTDGRRITTTELADMFFAGNDAPFHRNGVIISRLRSIINKQEFNDAPRRVRKSKPCGPHPIEVWIE